MGWFEIHPEGDSPRRGTLVCDATAAAAPMWGGPLLSVLEAFAEGPAADHPEVVFLGDGAAHPLTEVLRRAADPERLAAELGRGPVLGPWAARTAPRPTVVALMAGTTVLDLADYEAPDWLRNLRLYRFLGGDGAATTAVPEFGPADLGEAVQFLTDAPTELTAGGPGGVFLNWSPDAATADWDRLSWATPPGSPAGGPTRVEFHHEGDAPPTATLTRRSGAAQPCRVTAVPGPRPDATIPLTAAAETLLTLWGRGTAWSCDRCRAAHPPGFAQCANGDGSLLPTLPPGRLWSVRSQPGGRVAVCAGRGRVVTADGAALRLGPDGVECRRPDGTVEWLHSLFQRDTHGGHVVRT